MWKTTLIVFAAITYAIYCELNPKEVSRYCVDTQCISVVKQYKPVVSGGDVYIRIYQDRILFRFQLETKGYIELPLETHALISKRLVSDKFIVSSQGIPVEKHGGVKNINFDLIKFYSEEDADNISTYDLEYRNLY